GGSGLTRLWRTGQSRPQRSWWGWCGGQTATGRTVAASRRETVARVSTELCAEAFGGGICAWEEQCEVWRSYPGAKVGLGRSSSPPVRSAATALRVLLRRGGLEASGRCAEAWDRLRRALWCLPRNAWANW